MDRRSDLDITASSSLLFFVLVTVNNQITMLCYFTLRYVALCGYRLVVCSLSVRARCVCLVNIIIITNITIVVVIIILLLLLLLLLLIRPRIMLGLTPLGYWGVQKY